MNEFLKNFIIGGLTISIAEYFIKKDSDNIKYVAIMVHGVPLAFLTTFLLLKKNNNEILLVKNGILLSLIIALSMALLYYLLNSSNTLYNNKINATLITILFWFLCIYLYLNDKFTY